MVHKRIKKFVSRFKKKEEKPKQKLFTPAPPPLSSIPKPKEKVCLGPVRPTRDVSTFRKTGVSRLITKPTIKPTPVPVKKIIVVKAPTRAEIERKRTQEILRRKTKTKFDIIYPFDLVLLSDAEKIIVHYYRIKDNLHMYYNHNLIPGF